MYVVGIFLESILIWIESFAPKRYWSSSKLGSPFSSTTISPSRIAMFALTLLRIVSSSGYDFADVFQIAVLKFHLSIFEVGDAPHAIPFWLENMLLRIEWVCCLRQHWANVAFVQ